MNRFADRLKQLREEASLSQNELAQFLKTTRSRISMYEQGQREPDFEMQETIADYFNVDLDYIMGRTSIRKSISVNLLDENGNIDDFTKDAINFYTKYLSADKKTRKMIDMLLEEGE